MNMLHEHDVFMVTTVDLYSFDTITYITRMNQYIGSNYVEFEIHYVLSLVPRSFP